ncbi:peptidase inhibitor family I36 [Maritalea mobilis]|uniref:Peptidase inhibitor family I36 n=1 Tax=Maritalea mobilis TaxID=483324 RepID=A0A4R6VVV5_9HYPH|nr:SH3 domain-containing protein [Maritalea mobilis]TDQ66916.1 peptidase inhibitor family I36 [Maritalea mobilis]
MSLSKFVKTTSLALAGVTVFTGAAMAFPATSKTALNVRSGPGTNYRVVDALYSGERVNVERCTNSRTWCYVTHSGPDGWVSAKYLQRRSGGGNNGGSHNDNPGFSIEFGSDGTFSFNFGNRPNRPHRPPQAKACFYEHANYRGRSFCLDEGESVRRLRHNWNDTISSMRVFGGAEVTVCKHAGYRGLCRTVDRNFPRIGRRLNDEISSIKVQ